MCRRPRHDRATTVTFKPVTLKRITTPTPSLRSKMMSLAEFEAFVKKRFAILPTGEDEEKTWGMLPEQEDSYKEVKAFAKVESRSQPDSDSESESGEDEEVLQEDENSSIGSEAEAAIWRWAQSVLMNGIPPCSPPDTPKVYAATPDAPLDAVSPLEAQPPLPPRLLSNTAGPSKRPPPTPKRPPPTPKQPPPTSFRPPSIKPKPSVPAAPMMPPTPKQGRPTPVNPGTNVELKSLFPTLRTPKPLRRRLSPVREMLEFSPAELPDLPATPRPSLETLTPPMRRPSLTRKERRRQSSHLVSAVSASASTSIERPLGRGTEGTVATETLHQVPSPSMGAASLPRRSSSAMRNECLPTTSRPSRPSTPKLTIPADSWPDPPSPILPSPGEMTPKASDKNRTPIAAVSAAWRRSSLDSPSSGPSSLYCRRPVVWVPPVVGQGYGDLTPCHKRSISAPEPRSCPPPIYDSGVSWRPTPNCAPHRHREAVVHMAPPCGEIAASYFESHLDCGLHHAADCASEKSKRRNTILGKVDHTFGRDHVARVTGLSAQQQEELEGTLDGSLIAMLQDTVRDMLRCLPDYAESYDPPRAPTAPRLHSPLLRFPQASAIDGYSGVVRHCPSSARNVVVHEVDLGTPVAQFPFPSWREFGDVSGVERLEAEPQSWDRPPCKERKRLDRRPRGPRSPRYTRLPPRMQRLPRHPRQSHHSSNSI